MLRRIPFLSLAALALCLGDSARSQTVDEIEACFRANMPERTSVQTIKLRSTDRAGGERTLEAKLYWKRTPEGLSRTLIEIEAPPADRGSAYLWLEREEGEDMFVYLPELQRVRRIHPRTAAGSLFGTDFSYDDVQRMQTISAEQAPAERLPDVTLEGREVWVVQSFPVGTELLPPRYEKIVYFVDRESCIPLKIELYGVGAQLEKVAQVDPRSIAREGKGWMARSVSMRDLRNGTESQIIVEKIELDAKVSDRVFSLQRLERRGR
jgi:hypothetical protein